jgi:hypothetical protein
LALLLHARAEEALKTHKTEEQCKYDLKKIADQQMAAAQFESKGLEAKLGVDEGLAEKYWVCESLAKIQDGLPHVTWAKFPQTDDMRNTLVVELSVILGVPVKDLQGKLVAELVQLVHELV